MLDLCTYFVIEPPGEMRKEQCYAVKLAHAFTPDINMESSSVNSGTMAAVSNGKSICCGVSGGVQEAVCDRSSTVPNRGHEGEKVDAESVFNCIDLGDRDAVTV